MVPGWLPSPPRVIFVTGVLELVQAVFVVTLLWATSS